MQETAPMNANGEIDPITLEQRMEGRSADANWIGDCLDLRARNG
jgi:hypothetical protein